MALFIELPIDASVVFSVCASALTSMVCDTDSMVSLKLTVAG